MAKKLIKFSINTTVDGEDIVSSTLFSYGVVGCEIEDNNFDEIDLQNQYEEIPIIDDNKKAKVSFYGIIYDNEDEKNDDLNDFNVDENIDASYIPSNDNKWTNDEINIILYNVIKELHEYEEFNFIGSLAIEREDLTNLDYMNKWKEYFHKFYISNICIKPSFEKLDENDKDKIIINIDPKGAFGTGNHETTRMCINSILKYNDDKNNILDIGCGSGILGIVAKKVGIENVVSVDIDNTIYDTIKDNLDLNELTEANFNIYFGNVIDDKDFRNKLKKNKYDIIVANILAHIINKLILDVNICEMLNDNGILILSGILKDKKEEIIENLNNTKMIRILDIIEDGDWININCIKL